ncbi:hypothetical protein MEN41_23770, partial [Dolichospermum sp. ST_con]|nr:hypothetical protein [Dolichospermum sp. ST_con]
MREVHLEQALMWLHRQKLIRITEGLNLFYQSLKVKVIKDANIRSISPGYSKQIRPHYEEQARRTHIMIKYGEIDDNLVRQQLVQDYFDLPSTECYKLYSD